MLQGMFSFMYNDGQRFFAQLDAAGGQAACEQAWRTPPPWMHYIRYPDLYMQDRASGLLRFYEQLDTTLNQPPAAGWTAISGSNVDIDVTGATSGNQLAAWFATFNNDAHQHLNVYLTREKTASQAQQRAAQSVSDILKGGGTLVRTLAGATLLQRPIEKSPSRWELGGSFGECTLHLRFSGKTAAPSAEDAERVAGAYYSHIAEAHAAATR